MVDFRLAERRAKISAVKERLKPWSDAGLFEWVKSHQEAEWARIRFLTSSLESVSDYDFDLILKDFEILWLKAIADYLFFLRNGGGK